MTIKPIKTKKDYQQALARVEIIFAAKKDSSEGDELEIPGMLVDNYENEHFPVEFPDPVEAIKFRMEQLGHNQSDLDKVVGLKSRASEIPTKKENYHLK
ncbi:MAG: transcriptional regulator [Ginsengibacter sp.]